MFVVKRGSAGDNSKDGDRFRKSELPPREGSAKFTDARTPLASRSESAICSVINIHALTASTLSRRRKSRETGRVFDVATRENLKRAASSDGRGPTIACITSARLAIRRASSYIIDINGSESARRAIKFPSIRFAGARNSPARSLAAPRSLSRAGS